MDCGNLALNHCAHLWELWKQQPKLPGNHSWGGFLEKNSHNNVWQRSKLSSELAKQLWVLVCRSMVALRLGWATKAAAIKQQGREPSPNKDEKHTQTSSLMFADSPSKSSSPEKTQLDDVSSVSPSLQGTILWQTISPSYPTPSLVIHLFTELLWSAPHCLEAMETQHENLNGWCFGSPGSNASLKDASPVCSGHCKHEDQHGKLGDQMIHLPNVAFQRRR